jgi:anti-sigma regulatory factor (Ser/Thr protein kinase)
MCWQLEKTLPGDRTAPGVARALVRTELFHHFEFPEDAPIVDDALLVVSELVTNAVLAGSPSVTVTIELHVDELRIEVVDSAAGRPERRAAPVTSPDGRGLTLVAAVTDGWGVTPVPAGKAVWARFSLAIGTAGPVNCGRRAAQPV